MSALSWRLHPDGTFDLITPTFALRRAYPSLDREALKPIRVEVDPSPQGGQVTYSLASGKFVLQLGVSPDGLTLDAKLEGFSHAPHWVHPFSGGLLESVTRLFRTGVGFSGPTNFVHLKEQPEHFTFESYLCTGLAGENPGWLAVGSLEQHQFLQKCHVENHIHRRQFRNREIEARPAYFEAGFSTEGIPLSGAALTLPTLHWTYGIKAFDTLRALAGRIGKHHHARLQHPSGYHWCSWYERGPFLRHEDLVEFLKGARKLNLPLQAVLIDDGYSSHLGDWLTPNERWPEGLEGAFRVIREYGYTPGVWVGPFMVASRSRVALEHPEWLLHGNNGSRLIEWRDYNGVRDSEEHYVLDTTHPGAMDYLRHVFTTLYQWGASSFKTDFIEWGFKDSMQVRRHTPGKTSMQNFIDFLKMVRSCIGEESHWLGCISYFQPCIGYMDGMRVSSDTGPQWSSFGGTGNDGVGGGVENVVQEIFGAHYFNNVLWQNDPDCLFLRDYHIHMNVVEIRTLALMAGTLGVMVNTSDSFHKLSPDRLALWKFLQPEDRRFTARLPFYEQKERVIQTAVREYPEQKAWALFCMNPSPQTVIDQFTVEEVIQQTSVAVFSWSEKGSKALGEKTEFVQKFGPHESHLFYLSATGTPPPASLTLGGRMA